MASLNINSDIAETIEERTFGRYAESECIVISAFTDVDQDLEKVRICRAKNESLGKLIQKNSYRYAPVWGRFRRIDSSKVLQVQAFIVFNWLKPSSKKSSTPEGCLELKRLAESWCNVFGQEFYFYKEKGTAAKGFYTNHLGSVINTFEDLDPIKAVDAYFAALQQSAKESKEEPLTLNYVKGGVYTALDPCNLMAAMGRGIAGEVFLMPYTNRWN